METEIMDVQNFANSAMGSAEAGLKTDASAPAMTTPTAVQFVIQGSTICLIC